MAKVYMPKRIEKLHKNIDLMEISELTEEDFLEGYIKNERLSWEALS